MIVDQKYTCQKYIVLSGEREKIEPITHIETKY